MGKINLADLYKLYCLGNGLRWRWERRAVAEAIGYMKEAKVADIIAETRRLTGGKGVCELTVFRNLEVMQEAGLVYRERAESARGRPFIYKVTGEIDPGKLIAPENRKSSEDEV